MSEGTASAYRSRPLVLRGGVALSGEALQPQSFETLVIANGQIVGLDVPTDDLMEPVLVDLDGAYVLPGLIDCHVHFDLAAHPSPYEHWQAPTLVRALTALHNGLVALSSGITTVRDLGCVDFLVLDYAAAVERGHVIGPRVVAAGRGITTTGGHFSQYARVADGPSSVRTAVREQIGAGAGVIKLIATGGISTPGDPGASQLTVEEMTVAVEESHRRGLKVAAHAHTRDGVLAALRAGVDTIEHAAFADDETLQAIIAAHATLVPTVGALSPIAPGLGIPVSTVKKSLRARALYQDSIRRAIAAGVTIAAGTDAGTALNPIGGLVDELALYVTLGMEVVGALRSATVTAGAVVGADVGVVSPGRPADLIVVAGDPAEDLRVLRRPSHVVKGGRLIDMAWAKQTAQELHGLVSGLAA